jgi:hypothetical protein
MENVFDFNRFSVPGWWVAGRVLKRRTFADVQVKVIEGAMPVLRRVDRFLPWKGLSVIGVGVKR